ncbi:FecR family protein [Dyadobacter sp. SG02]|uniref:FecR family protein n=1 Tax=Dyadobacter sp. SG02 TaxID=1855291 RepID=UPI0008B2CBDA|nr:FecR domain-containing protein [Dyadobacter sp. SG02]SEJ80126.1 FecR family protein [Dyadobacter sp. SG02]
MEINPELLRKYHQGLCTPAEQAAVRQWLESAEFEAHDDRPSENEPIAGFEIWTRLDHQIGENSRFDSEPDLPETPGGNRLLSYLSAAMVVLAVGAAFYYLTQKRAVNAVAHHKTSLQPTLITVRTRAGEVRKHYLPDGSTVTLNASSQLSYPALFNDTLRKVELSGQAFFEVARDTTHPFEIQFSGYVTRVLGTSFDLKAYAGEPASLLVREGKVRFSSHSQSVLVTRGQAVLASGLQLAKTEVQNGIAGAWMDQKLVFNNEPLSEIARDISRWYGVEVEIRNPETGAHLYKGKFQNPSLKALLDDLGYVLNFRYEIREKKVVIY